MFVPGFVVHCFVSFLFCNHLDRADSDDCFTFLVFLVSCDCFVVFLFLIVPWVGLQCVIVVFSGHIHLLFCLILVFKKVTSKQLYHLDSKY